MTNCNFTNNQADWTGGGIYFFKKGHVINCNFINNSAYDAGAVYFKLEKGSVANCNFINNTARSSSGAIEFNEDEGSVTNCNFINNHAKEDGGAIELYEGGTVTDCNFTNNSAIKRGGALLVVKQETVVSNCNFINNYAKEDGGAIHFGDTSTVSDCNFIKNSADKNGGAIHFETSCDMSNCNFTGNSASEGSAIYFKTLVSSSTQISDSYFIDNRANAEDLVVDQNENNFTITFSGGNNLLNAIYSKDDKEFTLSNVCYWGENGIMNTDTGDYSISNKEAGQNITIMGVVNGNIINTIKSTDNSGNIVLENISGEYYLTFRHDADSYYTRTNKKIVTNIVSYTVNIISQKTNKRLVNITAKSNIYGDFMPGELVFIIQNGSDVNASYADDGIWWAVYEFANHSQYNVSASYTGLDNVTINNATITIERANSTLTINDNITFDYGGFGFTTVNFTNASGINASVIGQPNAIVNVIMNTITVSGLDVGTYILNVITIFDDNHNSVTKTANITVNKAKTAITAGAVSTTFNVNKYITITLKDAKGNIIKGASIKVNLNGAKTYTTNSKGQVKVPTKGLAPKKYTAKITFNGNGNYEKSAKNVKVTIKKAATKIIAPKKTFKAKTGVKKYAVVLKDNIRKVVKKAKLTLKVNGKTYVAKTNSKGKAIFKITKLTNKGSFKGVIKFNGNQYYNKAKSVKVKIIVK